MAGSHWYYAQDDQQLGPVSSAELRKLAASGQLAPDDLVWRDGMEDWVTARVVKGLFPRGAETQANPAKLAAAFSGFETGAGAAASAVVGVPEIPAAEEEPEPAERHFPVRLRHPFDLVLDALRSQFPPRFIHGIAQGFTLIGHYALYAAMLLYLSLQVAVTVLNREPLGLLVGLGTVGFLYVLQYTAVRFNASLERLNQTTGSRVSSTALLDCFALLALAAGAVVLFYAAGAEGEDWLIRPIPLGLMAFLLCEYAAFIAINPASLGIDVVPAERAGEEAIGVLSFVMKVLVQEVPLLFGLGVLYGIYSLLAAGYMLFRDGQLVAEAALGNAVFWLMLSSALPLIGYVVFLVVHLLVDVLNAVLTLADVEEPFSEDEAENV